MAMKSPASPRSNKVRRIYREHFKENAARRLDEVAVLDLVRERKISAARGAELLGMYIGDFLDLMGKHRVPYFTEEPRDIEDLRVQYQGLRPKQA